MLFQRIESKGLAHYSYLVGDGTEAVVIDPRRDCDVYVDRAAQEGLRVAHILETHRHEDFVLGSVELAARTGAAVWHADALLDYAYGQPAEEGQAWQVGRLSLEAIHTPGHTPGSMSYLLHDPGGAPWIVFTGDALFAGDVGRVDFLGPDRLQEMAGLLYDSVFGKLLPLGDEVIVCPAHGAGSVCGSAIAERVWTTVGLERRLNPRLEHTERPAFIAHVARELEKTPYFRRMEAWNLQGPPPPWGLPTPPPLPPGAFARQAQDAVVLDVQSELAFSTAHVPGSLSIWVNQLPAFAGWFLPYDRPILLVGEQADIALAVRYLFRMGYDDVVGYLAGGMRGWHMAGRESQHLETTTVQELCHRLDEQENAWILDVRSEEEVQNNRIPDAQHIHLTQLPQRMDEVPQDRPVYVFCGSDLRATTATSLLQRQGWDNLVMVLGGLAGWGSITCPLE